MAHPLRVLVVEDTEHVRRMLTEMLELDGFEVASVPGGAAAIDYVRDQRPDVVVLDFKMPDMDGIAAARAIKDVEPAQQIIIYTAFVDPELQHAAAEVGVADVLGKVEGLGALGREIRRLCAPI